LQLLASILVMLLIVSHLNISRTAGIVFLVMMNLTVFAQYMHLNILNVISCLCLCMQVPVYEDLGSSSFSVPLPEIQFTLNFLRVCTLVSVTQTHSTMCINC